MKKQKLLLYAILLMAMALPQNVFAYNFSAVAPTGQTLYYNIVSGEALVTHPGYSPAWNGYLEPTGALTIPSTVTHSGTTYNVTAIGNYAFSGCTGLTSITIPSSVTSIREGAFSGCSGLTSITSPSSVTSIREGAFSGCSGLTTFTIPSSVTSIGDEAFKNCSSLTSVSIPSSVTYIGVDAFSGCSGLTTVTIPSSVTSIGNSAFYGCSGLTSVTIPNSVTSIGPGAFAYCTSLTSVTIPNSIRSISEYTFRYCSGLTSIIIPNSVTSIGPGAFYLCSGLTSVTIPNSVTSIGGGAFYLCFGLTSVTIPNSVTSIGVDAFYLVKHIEYHGSATGAKWGANSLNGVIDGDFIFSDNSRTILEAYIGTGEVVAIPNSVTSIGNHAFDRCSGLTSVTIPNSVTSIGNSAFYGCSGLTSVTIPNSVTSIGFRAFSNCSGLTTVNFNPINCTYMGNSSSPVFENCTNLTTVNIGNSVTNIPNNAFQNCSGLTSITIPRGISRIGDNAFYNCSNLATVNYNADSCTYMGFQYYSYTAYLAFGNCSVSTINIGNNVKAIPDAAFWDCMPQTIVIPDSVKQIGIAAFYNCNSMRSITIGSSVNTIADYAFANCTILQTITVRNSNPPNINGSYEFASVPSNCMVTVPCGRDTVYRASNWGTWFSNIVTDTNCSEPNSTYYDFWAIAPSGDTLYYIILDSTSVTVVHPFYSDTTEQAWWDGAVQPTGTLTIPTTVTHNDTTYTVVRISEHAFYNCSTLTSVTIPSTVDSIGEWAFAYNTSLTTVSMGSAVTTIGYGAFYGCSSLNNLVIPDSLITIGSHAFSGCNVTSLTIPNTVTSIGSYAFSDWSGLTTITIPRSMTYIGDWAFAGCDSLTTVIFNADSCTYMGSSAAPVFDNDAQFNTLRIGNTVRYIPSNAFYGCNSIHTVNIPTSVSTIGDSAFANCSGLTSITSKRAVAPTTGANAFNGVTDTIPIYIPCGSTSSYASAWPHFTNFVEEMDAHVWVRTADATMGTARVSVQPTCDTPYATIVATPNAGYLFALWSDGGTLNPRTLMIDRDTALTAFFVPMPDTVINYDTIIVRDTLLIHDTTVVNNYIHDTTIVHDTSYVDVFIHDTTIVHDTTYVEVLVHDTTIVNNYIHDTAYVHDTTIVNNYIHDTTYINNYIYDTTIVNNYIHDTTYVHDTTIVNNYIHDTTYVDNYIYDTVLVAIPIDYYTLTLSSEQPSMGIVVGSGTYSDSTEVEIAAVAICGYHFVQWSDGNTESPRHVTMTGDLELAASFASDEVGITDVPSSNAHITVHGNVITVQGAEGQRVRIFDSVGRLLSTDQSVSETQHFRMMAAGVYLVQVGDGTAQRVVVGITR